jgi:hypothetical protein
VCCAMLPVDLPVRPLPLCLPSRATREFESRRRLSLMVYRRAVLTLFLLLTRIISLQRVSHTIRCGARRGRRTSCGDSCPHWPWREARGAATRWRRRRRRRWRGRGRSCGGGWPRRRRKTQTSAPQAQPQAQPEPHFRVVCHPTLLLLLLHNNNTQKQPPPPSPLTTTQDVRPLSCTQPGGTPPLKSTQMTIVDAPQKPLSHSRPNRPNHRRD